MWAHYTDSHEGFVIGFDSLSPFFQPGNDRGVDGLREVQYSEQRNRVPANRNDSVDDKNLALLNTSITFIKSSEWSYEEELRVLAHPYRANAHFVDSDTNIIYLFDFPPNSVKEMIIGHNAVPLLKEKISSAWNKKYPNADLLMEVLDNSDFKLRIKPFKD